MHSISTGILNRHRRRPQATRCRLQGPALLCHRHQRNHHRFVGIQGIQTQLRCRDRLIGLDRQCHHGSLQSLQMPVLTTAGRRLQLTVFGKLQQLCKQFHSRSWSRGDAVPLSDGVAGQNAILNRTLFQTQIGGESRFGLRLHVVTHHTGVPGLRFQHRCSDSTAGCLNNHGNRLFLGQQQRMRYRLQNLHLHPRNPRQIGHRQHGSHSQLPEARVRCPQQHQKDRCNDGRSRCPFRHQAKWQHGRRLHFAQSRGHLTLQQTAKHRGIMQTGGIVGCQLHSGQQLLTQLRLRLLNMHRDFITGRGFQQLPTTGQPRCQQTRQIHTGRQDPPLSISQQPVPVHRGSQPQTQQKRAEPRADTTSRQQQTATPPKLLQTMHHNRIQRYVHRLCPYMRPALRRSSHSMVSSSRIDRNHQ